MPSLRPTAKSKRDEIIFFVGPSWPNAKSVGRIRVAPLVACGDLAKLRSRLPRAVAIIDGFFEQTPSVWHKEILDLIDCGVQVYGAASMGAIRAAELNAFGMIGTGSIFEEFLAGSLDRDDAVMVLQTPPKLGNLPLTVSLVDARNAIKALRMPIATRQVLTRTADRLNFRQRTWSSIRRAALNWYGLDIDERLVRELSHQPSRKMIEAKNLYERLGSGGTTAEAVAGNMSHHTAFYRHRFAEAAAN